MANCETASFISVPKLKYSTRAMLHINGGKNSVGHTICFDITTNQNNGIAISLTVQGTHIYAYRYSNHLPALTTTACKHQHIY